MRNDGREDQGLLSSTPDSGKALMSSPRHQSVLFTGAYLHIINVHSAGFYL